MPAGRPMNHSNDAPALPPPERSLVPPPKKRQPIDPPAASAATSTMTLEQVLELYGQAYGAASDGGGGDDDDDGWYEETIRVPSHLDATLTGAGRRQLQNISVLTMEPALMYDDDGDEGDDQVDGNHYCSNHYPEHENDSTASDHRRIGSRPSVVEYNDEPTPVVVAKPKYLHV
jgi:hypothetical protein